MYEALLDEIEENNIELIEMPLNGEIKGLYADNVIAINKSIQTTAEKACVLAEELGHYHTSHGDILCQKDTTNRKQEHIAKGWAYERVAEITRIVNALLYGVRNKYELAEYLNVTEKLLDDALEYYKVKYGVCYMIGCYVLYFEPLGVLKGVE